MTSHERPSDFLFISLFGRRYFVGQTVCCCDYQHRQIETIESNGDATMTDGWQCSIKHCGLTPVKREGRCHKPTKWARFKSFALCSWLLHRQFSTDGFHACDRCGQSLDAETGQGLGWLGWDYKPQGY